MPMPRTASSCSASRPTRRTPSKLTLLQEYYSYEPYGLVLRRGDPAFRLAVDRALAGLYRSRGVIPIYEKWFGSITRATNIIQAMYLLNGLPE